VETIAVGEEGLHIHAAAGPQIEVGPAEVSGGGGCGGSTQSAYLTLGANAWTPGLCFSASTVYGTYAFTWAQKAYEISSSYVQMEDTSVSNGTYTGSGYASYGPYYAVDPANGTSLYDPGLICDLVNGTSSTLGFKFDATGVSTSDPPYGEQFIWTGSGQCPNDGSGSGSSTNYYVLIPSS
jgi:hypothetical protein